MKKNFILSLLFVGLTLTANAQSASKSDAKPNSQFQPGWYLGMSTGLTGFFGDTGNDFTLKNWSHNLGVLTNVIGGYDFNPIIGVRVEVGGDLTRWIYPSSRHSYVVHMGDVHLTGDFMVNLSNAIAGYNLNRVFDLSVYLGVGVADRIKRPAIGKALVTPVLRAGLLGTFHLTHSFDLNIDLTTNWVNDKYNGVKVSFPFDILNTAQVGLAYHFGRAAAAKMAAVPPAPQIVTKLVHDTVFVKQPAPPAQTITKRVRVRNFGRDVYFPINGTSINNFYQKRAISDAADFLNANPNAKLAISGYADKQTGTPKVNANLGKSRAQNVANVLVKQYKIDPSRLVVTPIGDTQQAYPAPPEANRVTTIRSTADVTTEE